VWLMAARNRALALDQRYLKELSEFLPRTVFGLNQVDLVEPLDWHPVLNGPSSRQSLSIAEIIADRQRRLSDVVEHDVTVVPFSAKARYNLQTLFTAIVRACPPDRAWLFSGLKSFSYDDFLTDEARRLLDDAARPTGGFNGIRSLLTRKLGI
jgi:predicted GTPase